MGVPWEALNARAAGLRTHLMAPDELARLASAKDTETLVEMLPPPYRPAVEETRDAGAVDRAAGRVAGERLSLLHRWAGEDRAALAGILEEDDRQGIRILLRRTAAGLASERRLDGLVPTPTFPARLQERAAGEEGVEGVARRLADAGHPLAPAIREELDSASRAAEHQGEKGLRPGALFLYRLEMALAREFARRSSDGAKRAGRGFRRFVSTTVDLENAWTLLSTAPADEVDPEARSFFVEGGERISREEFGALLAEGDREARRAGVARLFGDTGIGRSFAAEGPEAELEGKILAARRRAAAAAARRDPLGPGPLVAFVLAFRAEAAAVRRVAWGLSLGAPPALRRSPALEDR